MNIKKGKRIELENKLKTKPLKCPYCNFDTKFGFITAGYPIFWYDSMKLLPEEKQRLTEFWPTGSCIPTLKCNNCGIIIAQYE